MFLKQNDPEKFSGEKFACKVQAYAYSNCTNAKLFNDGDSMRTRGS